MQTKRRAEFELNQPGVERSRLASVVGQRRRVSWVQSVPGRGSPARTRRGTGSGERGISFEDVVFHIYAGDIIDTFDHPNQRKYPGQQIHAIVVEDYVYLVPFVESEDEVFLKTIIPSRKATKQYRGNDE